MKIWVVLIVDLHICTIHTLAFTDFLSNHKTLRLYVFFFFHFIDFALAASWLEYHAHCDRMTVTIFQSGYCQRKKPQKENVEDHLQMHPIALRHQSTKEDASIILRIIRNIQIILFLKLLFKHIFNQYDFSLEPDWHGFNSHLVCIFLIFTFYFHSYAGHR
jgi:hypothetical protein